MTHDRISRIRAVDVRAVRVPMAHPHQTAGGTVSESPLVLTDITTEDGVVGKSVVFTYTGAASRPTADLIRNREPLITGERLAPTEIEQKLSKRFRLLGTQGLVGIGLSAIDMALWDALARSLGVPLVCLLGRHSTDAARNAAQAGWLVSLRRSTMLSIRRFGPQSRQFLDRLCNLLADAVHSGVVARRRVVPATPPPRA